jgi:hypothetical protein
MNHPWKVLPSALLICALLLAPAAATPAASASSAHFTGTLADGATWIADVPSSWNGILLLFSHGFGPPVVDQPLGGPAHDAYLDRGYALAGSSYDPNGSWWALNSAVRDQFQAIDAVNSTALSHTPNTVLAVGNSMGGLVSALEAEHAAGHIDGALTTCGLVAGAIRLNNYQLDAEYAMSKLLAPGVPLKLVNFANMGQGGATGAQLAGMAQQAQTTPQGRARLGLALAFLNAPPAVPGQPVPDLHNADAVEAAEFSGYFVGAFSPMFFIEFARPAIEQSAGGNGSWTLGVDFADLVERSPRKHVVEALYREAGLDLRADLHTLTAGANIPADTGAIDALERTSVPTGHLQVPELDLHTIYDHLVPVEQERTYQDIVEETGKATLLRQAYVNHIGHCNFTTAELVAGVETLRQRVQVGHWGSLAEVDKLQQFATSLGLGDAAFIDFHPRRLTGDNGTIDPRVDAFAED